VKDEARVMERKRRKGWQPKGSGFKREDLRVDSFFVTRAVNEKLIEHLAAKYFKRSGFRRPRFKA
jgi:hypothetical protein